jgi:hypothetical protein
LATKTKWNRKHKASLQRVGGLIVIGTTAGGGGVIINLKSYFHTIIVPPVFADEHKNYIARLLYLIWWTYLVAAPLTILISIPLPETLVRWLLFNGVVYITFPIVHSLVRRGHTNPASWLTILEPWGVFTVLAATAGGINSPAVSIYPVTVFIAGLILGTRAAIIAAVLCSLTSLGLIFASTSGLLSAGRPSHTPVSLWLTNLGFLAIIVGIQYIANHTLQQALQRVNQELID